jgi:hypothetical protein
MQGSSPSRPGCLELIGRFRRDCRPRDDVAARAVDLVGEAQRDRLAGDGLIQIAVQRDDAGSLCWSCPRAAPGFASPGLTVPVAISAGKAPEIEVRPIDPLHRHAKRLA